MSTKLESAKAIARKANILREELTRIENRYYHTPRVTPNMARCRLMIQMCELEAEIARMPKEEKKE